MVRILYKNQGKMFTWLEIAQKWMHLNILFNI